MRKAIEILWQIVPGILIFALIIFGTTAILTGLVSGADAVGDYGQQLDHVWALLLTVAVSAAAATATLEIAKRAFLVRGDYQSRVFARWLTERHRVSIEGETNDATREDRSPSSAPHEGSREQERPGPGQVLGRSELLGVFFTIALGKPLGEGSSDYFERQRLTFFNIPIEQLAAQISDVGDEVVLYPTRYRQLADALVGDARLVSKLIREEPGKKTVNPDGGSEDIPPVTRTFAEAREHANASLQRGVESFQILVSQRWRRGMYLASVTLSFLFGAGLSLVILGPESAAVGALLSLTLGGFLSWVVRDIAAGIERWRGI